MKIPSSAAIGIRASILRAVLFWLLLIPLL